jgi:hypothetical protein
VPSVMPACVPLLWCPGLGVLGWEVVILGGGGFRHDDTHGHRKLLPIGTALGFKQQKASGCHLHGPKARSRSSCNPRAG